MSDSRVVVAKTFFGVSAGAWGGILTTLLAVSSGSMYVGRAIWNVSSQYTAMQNSLSQTADSLNREIDVRRSGQRQVMQVLCQIMMKSDPKYVCLTVQDGSAAKPDRTPG